MRQAETAQTLFDCLLAVLLSAISMRLGIPPLLGVPLCTYTAVSFGRCVYPEEPDEPGA